MKCYLLLVLLTPFLFSCSKLAFLSQGAKGQFSLLWDAKDNNIFLSDPNTSPESKEKILLIEEYKKVFETALQVDTKKIYSKTTMLPQDAVSYLVTAAPLDRVIPHEFSFLFWGKVPYLGFFKKESALKFKTKLESDHFSVNIRPVYAYSTLGYFSDPILSSFFKYDRYELALLVFHELFHVVLFDKKDIEFSENSAQLFARAFFYFHFKNDPQAKAHLIKTEKEKRLRGLIAKAGLHLDSLYLEKNREPAVVLESFLNDNFFPSMTAYCEKEKLGECPLKKLKWNNATFVSFMTYEKSMDYLEDKFKDSLHDPRELYKALKVEYKNRKMR